MHGAAIARLAGRRIGGLLLTMLLTSILVFGALYLAPGSPISFLIGDHTASPEVIRAVRAQYHLDDPFVVQYWHWLTAVAHGDFGTSIPLQQSVGSLLGPRVVTTVMLVVYAAVLVLAVGLSLGLVAALRGRLVDQAVLISTSVWLAVPSFVAAIALQYVFGVELGWFPASGAGTGLLDRLWHLTLPAVALAAASVAVVVRFTRAGIREESRREHVETAVARGLSSRDVLRRHVLRNALIPVTTAAGVAIASVLVGDVVVEKAFALDGIGALLIDSVSSHDFVVVQAIALLLAAAYVVLNTAVDLVYLAVDPRAAR